MPRGGGFIQSSSRGQSPVNSPPKSNSFGDTGSLNPHEIILKGDGITVINLDDLQANLEKLLKVVDVPMNELDQGNRTLFKEVSALIDKIVESGVGYQIQSLIQKTFGGVTKVTSNTIGMYFKGCYLSEGAGGSGPCGLSCAGSFQPIDANYKSCEDLVILYNGVLNFSLINKHTQQKRGRIYINSNRFRSFTVSDVEYLKKLGLVQVEIYERNGDKYNKTHESEIDKLETRPDTFLDDDMSSSNSSDNTNENWWVILVIAVIIIVIILFLLLLGWKGRQYA